MGFFSSFFFYICIETKKNIHQRFETGGDNDIIGSTWEQGYVVHTVIDVRVHMHSVCQAMSE